VSVLSRSSQIEEWPDRLASAWQLRCHQLLFIVRLERGLQLRDKGGICVGGEGLNIVDYVLELAGRGALDESRCDLDCRRHSGELSQYPNVGLFSATAV
jgi:hypothetical protein